ncbi:uncharacterized protein LOC129989457 [Argiope bruennichi]|uniref:uncharacterized protein LOC129989457 n=1 Tax=Argiope bruennichi TaxID=94029 RepID=UPI0024955890|nr:uncharacterized protein LOC129989457 [Argiope bruennichi]XP_055953983.1 uncharacterized protein LOC129989457 [Argiope bruennichi]
MSEDRRKNARTQGRFSGGDREGNSRWHDKQNSKTTSADKNKGEKRKAPVVGSRAQNEIDLQFEEDSNYKFKELETPGKPQELKFTGPEFILSETDNGISRLIYDPDFMQLAEAEEYKTILRNSTAWYDKNIVIRGVEYPQPRLVAWYGPHPYSYAGTTLEAREMPNTIREIKEKVEASLQEHGINVELNSVLLNLYRNGKDSVAWHSDDEFTLGVCPTIASVSLGETRKFEMRPKRNVENVNTSDILFVNLTHGSLIVMDGCMQKDWQHRVPKEYHDKGERINLTFRTIYPIDQLPPEMPYVSNMKSAKTPSAKVDHQQDHKFDAESFPPLGMEVNDKKNKCLPKENYNKDYQQSVKQRKHQKEENWDDEMFQNVEGMEEASKIQNNLNKKSSPKPTVDSLELHPSQSDNNSNIKESAKICNITPSDFTKCEYSDSSAEYQSHSVPNDSYSFEFEDPSTSENKPLKIDPESVEINAITMDSGKKYVLNADAPDFVPQKKFEKYSFYQLAKKCSDLKNEELPEFTEALFKCLDKNESHFCARDFYELEVYFKLMEDGSLNVKHQKIVIGRIGSMILNGFHKKNEKRYRNPSNSFDENNYQKHRQSYGRSPRY